MAPSDVPEILEVEAYRRLAAIAEGRRVVGVDAPDAWYLRGGATPGSMAARLVGATVVGARRRGKLLLIDTTAGVIGWRFGMTGRLVLDGVGPIDRLAYASGRDDPAWIRFGLRLDPAGTLAARDPRRLGSIEMDPDQDALGPDALSLTPGALRVALAGARAPLKARLLDQRRIAGLGNLLVDEACWRAGVDPARPAGGVGPAARRRLLVHLQATLGDLGERGGSHRGDLQPERRRGGRCPRDGALLQRRTIGGRTTYSCPRHQR